MWTFSRIGLVFAVIGIWAVAPAHARKAGGCADGRFVVTAGQQLLGDTPAVLVVHGGALGVEGACPTQGKATTRRKATRLSARWDRCGDVRKLRLQATARDCQAVRGTLRAPRKRMPLEAIPSSCGDGIVDAGAGEQCETGQACAGGGECSDCRCAGGAEPLECEVAGYPCTWAEVAPDVVQRSRELAEQAGAVLDGGGTISDAAAVIGGASPAELLYDERVIRFRLPGGRPMWVGNLYVTDPSVAPEGETPPPAAAPVAYRARSVVNPGVETKKAYVLDPYGWQPALRGKAAEIAGILSNVRGYEGRVTHLANGSLGDQTVTVSRFAQLAGNNVVYVLSHGGTHCVPNGGPCLTYIVAHEVDKEMVAKVEANQPGVGYGRNEHGNWTVVLTADFFRRHYPGGLDDALVVFDGCQSAGSDLAHALTGTRSNFVGWTKDVTVGGSNVIMRPFFHGMAQGRDIHEVYDSLGAGVKDPFGFTGAELEIGPQGIRIREVPRLLDPSSGARLTSSSTLEIEGYAGDGKDDVVTLVTEIEGASAAEGSFYGVHVVIDGVEFVNGPLPGFAQALGDYRWTSTAEFELGYDIVEGQTIEVEVTVDLPEGGSSSFKASPKLSGPEWSPGRVWHGTFTKVIDIGVATTTIVVDATFERDPEESGTTKYPTYLLKSGTMTWSLQDAGGDSCIRQAPTTTTMLGPDDVDGFTFNLNTDPVEYRALADTEGPRVPLTVTCTEGSDPPVTTIEAGGVWFLAPADAHYTVSDETFTGTYAANSVSFITWTLSKVE